MPVPGSKALADYIEEHVAAFGETPELFPPEGVDALARASRAAYARIHPLLLERARSAAWSAAFTAICISATSC